MSDSKAATSTFPADAVAISSAFASSLHSLDEIHFDRLEAIAKLVETLMGDMIELVEKANRISSSGSKDQGTNAIKKQANEAKNAATEANDSTNESAQKKLSDLKNTLAAEAQSGMVESASRALSNAYENAVLAQQQSYVLSQAALTQGVSSLYSLVEAAVGVNEKKHIEQG